MVIAQTRSKRQARLINNIWSPTVTEVPVKHFQRRLIQELTSYQERTAFIVGQYSSTKVPEYVRIVLAWYHYPSE